MTPVDTGLLAEFDRAVAERSDQLVGLAADLVRCDTTSVDLEPGSEHTTNEEGRLQALVGERMAAIGMEVDQFEPDPADLRAHPMMPPWHHWEGRPISVGTLHGTGGGRSLIVNGHIDVVAAGDLDQWSVDPFAGTVRDGRLWGRGSSDMKGGVAAAIFALELLSEIGAPLSGDVILEAVPDEETCAMGTVTCIERGYAADAGVVPEPTRLQLWIATRGLLHGSIRVPGRSAHAEVNQPPWREGGGVNAIRAAQPLLEALSALEADWAGRESKRHPLLGAPQVQPTGIEGGVFISNVPESCTVALNATYLPADADADGYGSVPRAEIEAAVRAAARGDDWLVEHPVEFSWATDYPPSEIPPDHDIVRLAQSATAEVLGAEAALEGIDTTYDGALLTMLGGTVAPAIGPGDLARAHAPDEWIGIDELLDGARVYGRIICGWCS
jgi:acetylornithine deacetylase